MGTDVSGAQSGKTEPLFAEAIGAARRLLTAAAALSFFVNLLMLTGPLYMLQIYDRVLGSRSMETLAVITALTLALFAGMAVLDFARGALLARSADAFEDKLYSVAFDVSMDAGRAGAASAEQPLKDLRQIRQFTSSPALTAVFDAPWTPLFIFLVFLMHWLLGLVALIGLAALATMAVMNERLSRSAAATANASSAAAERIALSAIRNAAAADAMGMRGRLKKRWRRYGENANASAALATDRIGGVSAATKAMRLFLQSAILGTGAYLAIKGEVSPGVMIAASIITGRALAPAELITAQWRQFSQTGAAFQRLRDFIHISKDAPQRTALPAPSGALSVSKLVCRPGVAPKPVLKGVSFELAAGETLGVIGPSAAGKSTLARALVGVEAPIAGDIRLDGAAIGQWDREALGAHVGFLPQEVELFSGTAAENIARFSDVTDDSAIVAAATAAGAHDMILGLPGGYDTDIGESGRHLSAGQRQRLGLARALYGAPRFVVLDEPNANLDADGDAALAQAVKDLKGRGATTIIIAHRAGVIAGVDKLMLLVDGEIRAIGPRDEILQKIAPRQIASFDAEARARQKQAGGND